MEPALEEWVENVRMLTESAGAVVPADGTLARVRAARFTEPGFSREVWATIVEMGWLGICLGEEAGGYGLGLVLAEDDRVGPLLAGAGNGDGARTFVGYLPDSGLTFAVAVNIGDGTVPIVETLSASTYLIGALRELLADRSFER